VLPHVDHHLTLRSMCAPVLDLPIRSVSPLDGIRRITLAGTCVNHTDRHVNASPVRLFSVSL
jgi:hypothetical protein